MYRLLGGLKEYLKRQDVQIDNVVFRMHNLFTTVLLMTCSLIITATQYVGNPIQCIVQGLPTHVINTFCWISSTFTMPDAFQRQDCGFGCQIHHVIYCLIMAYGTERMLILKTDDWKYNGEWESIFLPLSDSCKEVLISNVEEWLGTNEHNWILKLPAIAKLKARPLFLPNSIPEDLFSRISHLHGNPVVWWVGQFAKYVFRLQPNIEKFIEQKSRTIEFLHPIVGVHIRRTDKLISEAESHPVEEYMEQVEEYFNQLEVVENVTKRRIFIATDDANVISEVAQKYPHYELIYDINATISTRMTNRFNDPTSSSLKGSVASLFLLSLSNFAVLTLSSNVGTEVAHPGVANDFGDIDAHKYYTYYQWVCFVLFFQALLCYTPKFIWDALEGGLMNTLVMGLNIGICSEAEKNKKKKVLIDYLIRHIQRHNMYAIRYWICEALCLVNIIAQLYYMNYFFDGEFFSYGLRVLNYSETAQEDRVDPMVYVFPRVTKCTFHKYGASGTIQTHDSLCILPLNIVNEKTYIFIWFWFIILATLLSLLVVYRALMILLPKIRPRLLHARNRMVPLEVCDSISRKTDLGDWWVLYMLGSNMDPLIFREILSELAKKIETNASNQTS